MGSCTVATPTIVDDIIVPRNGSLGSVIHATQFLEVIVARKRMMTMSKDQVNSQVVGPDTNTPFRCCPIKKLFRIRPCTTPVEAYLHSFHSQSRLLSLRPHII
jgi:hypothetical protein